ncbi:MAG TPA: UDP-3-O-(3-hydroxymyristoyl)glucosamine N-acyltransferase [Gammaproteobacteria bacterium]|nr:UDP-3-O-(3-hydroxymyristoyl)glucosamine N-acyltransferase [Gammaproteobacteria bacterium]
MAYTLGELSERLGVALHGDADCRIERVATLQNAEPGCISFLANRRYQGFLGATRASAVILESEFLPDCAVNALVSANPYLSYAQAAALLNPERPFENGIHASASVAADARVHPDAHVGPQCSVASGAEIGPRSYVGPGCVIEENAKVGEDARLVAHVTLCRNVRVGKRAILHPGVVIGADGFGIANDNGRWVKVPQIGSVIIGDDVEVGANTTIDRGALEDTVIEDGVKLDNLIQVGHNVQIGAHTAVAACVAIGGSARIGKRCTIGGAASIAGHLEIADDVHLTATSAVPNSIREAGVYSSGMPIQENKAWRKNVIRMRQLDDMARRLKSVEKRLKELNDD